jgi:RecA-family ATPase
MLAMHTMFCLSTGTPWLGFPTAQSSVLMAQVEIPKTMMKKRIEKYVTSNNITVPNNIWMLNEPYLRLDKMHHYEYLRLLIETKKPQVIIIDPIYKVFSGDITDNFQVLSLLDKLDELAAKYNLAYILIGHTRKRRKLLPGQEEDNTDLGDELVGASYFQDWCDTSIHTQLLTDTTIMATFTKVRHAEVELGSIKLRVDRNKLNFTKM